MGEGQGVGEGWREGGGYKYYAVTKIWKFCEVDGSYVKTTCNLMEHMYTINVNVVRGHFYQN